MKTYSVLFAKDVPYYGCATIEAENDDAALEAAKAFDHSAVTNDPEWENSVCARIVYLEDPDGNTIINDVPLDNYDLRYGGDKERRYAMPRETCWTRCNSARTFSLTSPGSMMERLPLAPLTPRARRSPRRREV